MVYYIITPIVSIYLLYTILYCNPVHHVNHTTILYESQVLQTHRNLITFHYVAVKGVEPLECAIIIAVVDV